MDRQTKRDWLWLAVLGLLVQAFWAARLAHPSYFDAYYYTIGGQQLATGQGFTEPVIWQYLDDPAGLVGRGLPTRYISATSSSPSA